MDDDRSYNTPIEIKATIVQNRYDEIIMDWVVDGRFEIKWTPDTPWVNLGIASYAMLEWQLLTSNHMLGARHSKGAVSFTIEMGPGAYKPRVVRGCDEWPRESPGA